MEHDLISKLMELTYQMAATDPGVSSFDAMLERRGELMRQLCSGPFDPNDSRVERIERDGAELQSIVQSRCTLLRDEMIVLARAAIMVDSVKSTLVPIQHACLDISV